MNWASYNSELILRYGVWFLGLETVHCKACTITGQHTKPRTNINTVTRIQICMVYRWPTITCASNHVATKCKMKHRNAYGTQYTKSFYKRDKFLTHHLLGENEISINKGNN